MWMRLDRTAGMLTGVVLLLALGCARHHVDTVPEWCEQITGVNLADKYQPFWGVIFSVSFDGDAIRDDFVREMNKLHLEKVQHRSPRMAWREGTAFHLINLSTLLQIEPVKIIEEWRQGIEADKAGEIRDRGGRCLFGMITSLFDSMHIHSITVDALGRDERDDVTVIPTDRESRLGKHRL